MRESHLLLDRPVESVQGENTKLGVVVGVGTTAKKELGELGDVLTEQGDFLHEV